MMSAAVAGTTFRPTPSYTTLRDVTVEHIRRAGFAAYEADVTQRPSEAFRAEGPFDLVVAGELIEHLGAPQALFTFARALLRPRGELLITTPHPYAAWRSRTGQMRLTGESVDHVGYLSPSGIAEMCSRTGMPHKLATTLNCPDPRNLRRAALLTPAAAAVRKATGCQLRAPNKVQELVG